jgi:hypothetical protein
VNTNIFTEITEYLYSKESFSIHKAPANFSVVQSLSNEVKKEAC